MENVGFHYHVTRQKLVTGDLTVSSQNFEWKKTQCQYDGSNIDTKGLYVFIWGGGPEIRKSTGVL